MAQRDYERILASLSVERNHVKHVEITKSVRITNYKNIDNKLIIVNQGSISWDQGNEIVTLHKGEMCFLPELSEVTITYGANPSLTVDNNYFTNHQDLYLKEVNTLEGLGDGKGSFTYVSFNAKIYEAIDFFKFVDIAPFKIGSNQSLYKLFQNIITEIQQPRLGQREILGNLSKNLVIELIRYIIENNLFIEKLVLKGVALTDLRLATLFKYIANNISDDLSNKVMAQEIGLSKDYIGQYFKNITDMNLQRYIEIIRLNRAVNFLKSNPNMKIREVAQVCGFSDLAYFCRKFKQQWGITARKMRLVLAKER